MSRPTQPPGVNADLWSRSPTALWRDCVDRIVLLPPDTDKPIVVAGTGAVVWELLAGGSTVGEMVRALTAAFDADATTITADVTACLEELHRLRLVERSSP